MFVTKLEILFLIFFLFVDKNNYRTYLILRNGGFSHVEY